VPRVTTFPAERHHPALDPQLQVDRWNDYCLGELPGPESVREAETCRARRTRSTSCEKNLLTPDLLRLKPGARVMFTVNRPDDGFVNGQTGVVVSIGGTSVVVASPKAAKSRCRPTAGATIPTIRVPPGWSNSRCGWPTL
jgi:hypothetical protein